MPLRDDYCMLCYGFYKEFTCQEDADEWTDGQITEDADELTEGQIMETENSLSLYDKFHQNCVYEDGYEVECLSDWDIQHTNSYETKFKVFVYLKKYEWSVGSRTGEFYQSIGQINDSELPKSLIHNDTEYFCGWHMIMWGVF